MPIRRRRSGELAAGSRVHALFEEHGRMVYGLCRVLMRDPVEAEDATQQSFLLAFRALLDGQEPQEERAWLAQIARNECLMRIRSASVRPIFVAEDADLPSALDTAAVAEGNDARASVLDAVRELPPQQRDAFVLRELFGLSYEEIAAALDISRSSVESLLFRARQRLQSDLEPVRTAFGALAVPFALKDALPAFGAAAAGGAGAGTFGSLAAFPTAAKLAAAAIAIGGAGTAAGVEVAHHHRPAAPRAPVVDGRAESPPAPQLVRGVTVAGARGTLPAPTPVPETAAVVEAVDDTLPTESVETVETVEELADLATTSVSDEVTTAGTVTALLETVPADELPPPAAP